MREPADGRHSAALERDGGRGGRGAQTAEQQEAQQRLQAWRAATTPATWKAVRKQFDDVGINVRILWYSLGFQGTPTSDEEIEYAFRMAQGLGVKVMSGSSTIPIAPAHCQGGGEIQDPVGRPHAG